MPRINKCTTRSLMNAAALAAAVLALAACNRSAETAANAPADAPATVEAPQTPDSAGPNGAAIDPHAAIVPEAVSTDNSVPGTGPAEGGTAIGGVVAGQDASKPRDKGASEPTGGDGATTQPAATPGK